MTGWPDNLRVVPLTTWPQAFTAERRRSPFRAAWSATMDLLDLEIWQVGGRNVVLQVAIEPNGFRLDGRPRATAKQTHPGVILNLDSNVGPLEFPCDTFDRWQDNLRAIALSMQALRKMDRYGVTKRGQQYTGWKALPSAPADAAPSTTEAAEYLRSFAPAAAPLKECLRAARAATHPDRGNGRSDWNRVEAAAKTLGLL